MTKPFKFSDTLFIAVFSVLVYLCVFSCEYAYCTYFKIPVQLISLDIRNVFKFISIIPFLLILAFLIVKFIPFLERMGKSTIGRGLFLILFWFFIGLFFLKSFNWLLFFAAWLVGVSYFIFPIFQQYSKKPYMNKLRKRNQIKDLEISNYPLLKHNIIYRSQLFILFSIFFLFMTQEFGRWNAVNRSEFDVIGDNLLVLAIYNDRFICAELDRETKTIGNKRIIINLDSKDINSFSIENIGHITLAD